MIFSLGYGKTQQSVEIPDSALLGVIEPNGLPEPDSEEAVLRYALENPIGTAKLREIVKPGEKISIITSDLTRPCPSARILPAVLNELNAAGIPDKDIIVTFALGSHRFQTEEEKIRLAGKDVYDRVLCRDSDKNDVVHIGTTGKGTPVDIDRVVAGADRRICIGNIEYHYFAGYSGGAKAIMPGVSTPAAIQSNHRMMIEDDATTAKIDGNPIREDLEEAAAMVGVDFILNVVLDAHKNIVHAVAGDMIKAHREGCRYLDKMYLKEIPEKADIVIASQGGAPKDVNLYQTQKALDNAARAVKDGGVVILVGACQEGFGHPVFEQWIKDAPTADSIIERIHDKFALGGHKAASFALVLRRADIYLVSEMPAEDVKAAFMQPFSSAAEAYSAASEKLGPDAKVWVIPFAGSTLPSVKG